MKTHMPSIEEYKGLINSIPVYNQSARIKREVWKRVSYKDKERIENEIFGDFDEVELSREDVISEIDISKKIVMVLMWGYPTTGRGSNIQNILTKIDKLNELLSKVENQNLTMIQANNLIEEFKGIHGLGVSTWSKLLYFFGVKVNSKRCQIYDLKIVDSLNKKQFAEQGTKKWKQDVKHYYQFLELVDSISASMDVLPEQVELFLFYYNLYYKF